MDIAFNTAVTGMLNAQTRASAASESVVHAAATGEGIIQALVAVKQAEATHQASAAMVKVADDMQQVLLDILV
tara:strand:- start:10703 stop:10921 length:219 start_codon:yes stop_codon:yes gene_type:complete